MTKKLSEMTLEELWQLFPIFLTEHQACWKHWYEEEAHLLRRILPADGIHRISHIGSTAVDTVWAKPIVDILIEAAPETAPTHIADLLTAAGYLCMNRTPTRVSLNKGYTATGFAERVFHLHIRLAGDCDELYFRDYLRDHPEIARDYEALKLSLWKKFEHDRDGYTGAKTEFITKYTDMAKELYQNRY